MCNKEITKASSYFPEPAYINGRNMSESIMRYIASPEVTRQASSLSRASVEGSSSGILRSAIFLEIIILKCMSSKESVA